MRYLIIIAAIIILFIVAIVALAYNMPEECTPGIGINPINGQIVMYNIDLTTGQYVPFPIDTCPQ